eukprot:5295043-Pleurochrysis_carterae.AAC.1
MIKAFPMNYLQLVLKWTWGKSICVQISPDCRLLRDKFRTSAKLLTHALCGYTHYAALGVFGKTGNGIRSLFWALRCTYYR